MNKRTPIIFLFVAFLLYTIKVNAKAILLDEEAGLNNIAVTAITKDKGGIMWIATKQGLNKYDGYTFTEIPFFKKFMINTILYDALRNSVWIGTEMGLFYMDCETQEIIQCTSIDRKNEVTCLLLYRRNIIVGFQHKYILQINVDFSCKLLYSFVSEQLHPNNMVCNNGGDVYICLKPNNTIIKIDAHTKRNNRIKTRLTNRPVDYLSIVNNELFAGGFNDGVWNVNESAIADWYLDSLNAIPHAPEYMLESNGSVLIAYRNPTKVYEMKVRGKSITDLTANDSDVFNTKRIYCLFADEFNIIWVGTSRGIIKIIPDKPKPLFEKLLYYEPRRISTRQIIEDVNGDVYVASYSGFLRYEKATQKWHNWDKIIYEGKSEPFAQRSLLNVDTNYIYIGSDANYFVCYNKKSRSIENLRYNSNDGMCNTKGASLALAQDGDGRIWLGSGDGLLSFDIARSELSCHTKDKYSVEGMPVRCIYMLPGKKQFWAGTDKGAYLVDKDKGTIFHIGDHTTPALTGSLINAITSDTKGNIWIATDIGGINVLSSDLKEIYTIAKKDGLSSNEVYDLLWQDSVQLWISTYNGLNYYQTQTQTIVQYFKQDGITDNEFNQNSSFKAPDGRLYFGGINGITTFYPPQMEIREQAFEVFVSGITKWEKKSGEIVDVVLKNDNKIVMYPGDNLLTFSFAGTDYTHPGLYSYYYKIEGQHADWILLGPQSTLRLESLKSGDYKLLVKGTKGSRGTSSANILTYHLSVKQEFYQTIWFYVLVAMGLASLIYFYFSNRLRTQKKLELLRMKIASDLHDEVGSLLTRITMSADRLVTRMSRDSETRDKLEGVSTLSREANVAMSDVLWTIDSRNDFTGSLTDRMREHAEDLLLPRGVNISIDFSEIDQQKKLSPEFRQHLFLLYKEMINNIIKHSKALNVEIMYKQSKEHCILKVKNDGVISGTDAVHSGQGLSNIKMRAGLLKGTSTVKKEEDLFEITVII
jgi:ligand-binding sensor domain-containing protein